MKLLTNTLELPPFKHLHLRLNPLIQKSLLSERCPLCVLWQKRLFVTTCGVGSVIRPCRNDLYNTPHKSLKYHDLYSSRLCACNDGIQWLLFLCFNFGNNSAGRISVVVVLLYWRSAHVNIIYRLTSGTVLNSSSNTDLVWHQKAWLERGQHSPPEEKSGYKEAQSG